MPFCHNLLGITSRESLVGFTNISWDSAMNLANCDPFFCLLLTSFSNFGRECSVFGLGFGDSDGIKAHIDESSSFGWSSVWRISMFCISVYKTTSKHLLLSAMFPYAKEQTKLDKPCANLKIGAKTTHGMLKLRCGIIVPAPCLALLQIQTKT